MASTVHVEWETKLVCDRCRAEATIRSNVNPKDRENWLRLQTDEGFRNREQFDFCPQCDQDFRERFMKVSDPKVKDPKAFLDDFTERIEKAKRIRR